MRMHQYMGLTKKAERFLEVNIKMVPDIICPKCKEVITMKRDTKPYSKIQGMYPEDTYALLEYYLKDGTIVKEVLQAQPWSSGPMSFICLELENGKKIFKWSKEEIDSQ